MIIDSDFSLLFPDDYINSISERLRLYTELNDIKTEENLQQFESNITDRFGPPPTPVVDLLDSVRIKWIGTQLGLEKIIMKNQKFVGYFISDQNSSFFDSPQFSKLLQYVQQNPKIAAMKEKKTRSGLRLLLTFNNIKSVKNTLNLLNDTLA